ncbi:MAG: hypothetical protein ACI80S_001236, partial [Pseudohongiellaceae bacterium]
EFDALLKLTTELLGANVSNTHTRVGR